MKALEAFRPVVLKLWVCKISCNKLYQKKDIQTGMNKLLLPTLNFGPVKSSDIIAVFSHKSDIT